MTHSYSIFSLGDSAVTIDLGNSINEHWNRKVLAMQQWLQEPAFEGLMDIITAYSSLTVLYDPVLVKRKYQPPGTIAAWVGEQLEKAFRESGEQLPDNIVTVDIPVCYSEATGMDLAAMAQQKKLSIDEIIHLHTSVPYRVYMIGFLPGFSYLAEVDTRLITPRKPRPVTVLPGSVGIAGSQTGIYPLASPGGWNIIGRTPV
ncbi:MAG TPA: 5-oxoprolinase subunit PxpB, partial [Chitinophagaceae bacterium]